MTRTMPRYKKNIRACNAGIVFVHYCCVYLGLTHYRRLYAYSHMSISRKYEHEHDQFKDYLLPMVEMRIERWMALLAPSAAVPRD